MLLGAVLNVRDEFSQNSKNTLFKRVGGCCSNPRCRKPTSGPHSDFSKSINIGVAAHITAAEIHGPRYDSSLTQDERKSAANGIWLCQDCAKLIDSDVIKYAVHVITEWKKTSEEIALSKISSHVSVSEVPKDFGKNLLFTEFSEYSKTFIRTYFYDNALNALKRNNCVLLSGYSMMGKTATSIMLAASFDESYDIIYNQNLSVILDCVSKEPNKLELILIDDFLGQDELMDSKYLSELEKLLKKITKLSCKKLILNSRKSLLTNLKVQYKGLFYYLENEFVNIEIDLSKSQEKDIEIKLKILKSYIESNNLPKEYVEKIWNKEVLTKVLTHDDFSPLAIEYATKPKSVEPDDYEEFFMKKLDEADSIWSTEIASLNINAKVYLCTLVSLSSTTIDKTIVDECFEQRFSDNYDEFDDESFENTFKRLECSLIKWNSSKKISVYHPSLFTYVLGEIGEKEKKKILDCAIYIEQFETFNNTYAQKKLKELILTNDFFNLKVMPAVLHYSNSSSLEVMNSILLKYLKYIHDFNIKESLPNEYIIEILNCVLKNNLFLLHSIDVIVNILLSENYDLIDIFTNEEHMKRIFRYSNMEDTWKIIGICVEPSDMGLDFQKMPLYIQEVLKTKLGDLATYNITELLESEMDTFISERIEEYEAEYLEDDAYEIVYAMENEFASEILEKAQLTFQLEAETNKLYNIDFDSIEYNIIDDDGYLVEVAMNKLNDHLST